MSRLPVAAKIALGVTAVVGTVVAVTCFDPRPSRKLARLRDSGRPLDIQSAATAYTNKPTAEALLERVDLSAVRAEYDHLRATGGLAEPITPDA